MLLLFPEVPLFHRQSRALRAGFAALENDFRQHEDPYVDSTFLVINVPPNPLDIQFDRLGDGLMVIENARCCVDSCELDRIGDEVALVKRDRESLLNSGKIREMQTVFLLALARWGHIHSLLDLCRPIPKMIEARRSAHDAN